MVMHDAFKIIFDESLIKVKNDISKCSNFEELNEFNNDLFRTNFINTLIDFFKNNYNCDIMPLYLYYMSECDRAFENYYCEMFQNA